MHWLALDIGGANIKLADGEGYAESLNFNMWRQPARLANELRGLIANGPECTHLAITMTGELADCFENKAAGVTFILDAVNQAADGRHTRVYLTNGKLVTPQVAKMKPALASASNWHALAKFCGRYASQGTGLLIDVGSTTTDIVPMLDGEPTLREVTDLARLQQGTLVYTGVQRSPVCAVVNRVPYRNKAVPVAQELFATTWDVYLLLDEIPEQPNTNATADGKPATKGHARVRLGRMICADDSEFHHGDAVKIAQFVSETQAGLVAAGLQQVLADMPYPPEHVVVSGHGDFLAKRALSKLNLAPSFTFLTQKLGPMVSRCATAHALAVLAREAEGVKS